MKNAFMLLAVATAMAGCSPPPVNRDGASPLSVTVIDLARYGGLWYEIARFPNSFERNCAGVTAQYTLRPDARVSVVNTCRKGGLGGEVETARGIARVADPATNAKLKVSFFGPFEGDYWVLDRAEDYSWALVGEPSGRYLWMLSRTRQIEEGLKTDLLRRLAARGYNLAALEWTAQERAR